MCNEHLLQRTAAIMCQINIFAILNSGYFIYFHSGEMQYLYFFFVSYLKSWMEISVFILMFYTFIRNKFSMPYYPSFEFFEMAITEILFISRWLKLFLPVICYVDSQFYISGFRYILQIERNFRCTGSKKLIVFVFKYCSKSLVIKYAYQIITRTLELKCVELDFNKRFVFNAFLESHR